MNPYVYTTDNHLIVFYGYLTNLDDLVARCSGRLDPSLVDAVHNNWNSCMLERNRDIGTLSADVVLQSYIDNGEGNELVLLSELQV
jgi:hypothetical protein